eukprot:g12174.t1
MMISSVTLMTTGVFVVGGAGLRRQMPGPTRTSGFEGDGRGKGVGVPGELEATTPTLIVADAGAANLTPEYTSSILTDPDTPDDSALTTNAFSCADGEFLIAADPSVVDHFYTDRRDTYTVKLIQCISWECSDGEQSEPPGSLDFNTDAASTSTTPAGNVGVASFTGAITGVAARYLPYPECASTRRGGVVTDTVRCYHFGAMSFSGYDTLAGGRMTVGSFGDDAYFSDAAGAIETFTECAEGSFANGFLMGADGTGLLELRLVCAEHVPGVCEPPGFGSGGAETPAPAAVTATPSPSGGQSNDDGGVGGDSESNESGWPPSWWVDGDTTGAVLIVGGVGGFVALGLCCHLLRACARKVCGFGFTDFDGNWGEVENEQDDNCGGDGGGRGAVGVAGTWDTSGGGGGESRVGYGRVGNGYAGGGGWFGGRGSGGDGVNGNWGDADCDDTVAGEYRYDGYGAPSAAAAAAASPMGPFSPTFRGGNGSNNHHQETPMNTPASPAGGGGGAGYSHNSRFSPLAVSTSDGLFSPPRIETPTAPARDDIEDEQLQAAIAASTPQRSAGVGDLALPLAVPVPD